MKILTTTERFHTYVDTLNRCGGYLYRSSDSEIAYNIFEEFIVGVVSFLYDNNLELFEKGGLIDEDISGKSRRLRAMVLAIEYTDLWSIDAVRSAQEWRDIITLSDEIKDLLSKQGD